MLNNRSLKKGSAGASLHCAINRATCSIVFLVSSPENLSNFDIFQFGGYEYFVSMFAGYRDLNTGRIVGLAPTPNVFQIAPLSKHIAHCSLLLEQEPGPEPHLALEGVLSFVLRD